MKQRQIETIEQQSIQQEKSREETAVAQKGSPSIHHPENNIDISANHLLQAQQTFGNRYTQNLVQNSLYPPLVQPKLIVGPVNDKYEQEADRVAQQVSQNLSSSNPESIQRQAITPINHSSPNQGVPASPEIEAGIEQARGGGRPLPDSLQNEYKNSLGTSFTNVQIHNNGQADQLAKNLGALAFTHKNDIFFRSGAYSPDSNAGKELLTHELAHVMQQNSLGLNSNIQRRVGFEFENKDAELYYLNDTYEIPEITSTKDLHVAFEANGYDIADTVDRNKHLHSKNRPQRHHEIAKGHGWTLEADDTNESNAEIIVHGLRNKKDGFYLFEKHLLFSAMDEINVMMEGLRSQNNNDQRIVLSSDLIAPKITDKNVLINLYPDVPNESWIVQATVGIRLDMLHETLIKAKYLSSDSGFNIERSEKTFTGNAHKIEQVLPNYDEQIPDFLMEAEILKNSDEFKGLATLISIYLNGAKALSKEDFLKNLTPFMSRNNFVTLVNLLPDKILSWFYFYPEQWVEIMLTLSGFENQGDEKMFTNKSINLTRKEWLLKMLPSLENDTPKDLLVGQDEEGSIGGLGSKLDTVESIHENKAPIFEFRKVDGRPPASWSKVVTDVVKIAERIDEGYFPEFNTLNRSKDISGKKSSNLPQYFQ